MLASVIAAAAYVIAFGLGEGKANLLAFDVYGYFYPNILHALRSLAAGGRGLLWNPFQNCGQPFFAITETGLLYPFNALFLVASPQIALRALLFTNLVIGGLGAYCLLRELGSSAVGAVGGALTFMLGTAAYNLTTWMPTIQAPYMWMPVAMLYCERLIKAPRLAEALLLGLVLAVGLLPGHPQFVLFTCQLIALRVLWSALDGAERARCARALGGVVVALVVMLLLTAVQFLASLELTAESVRHGSLSVDEVAPQGNDTLAGIAKSMNMHSTQAPFTVVQGVLAAVALANPARRRIALFYLFAGVLFFVLSFGVATPLGRLYYTLPIASLFRWPLRFRFVTGFCAAVLSGLAIDVVASGSRWALAVAAAGLLALYMWLGLPWVIDRELIGAVLGGGLLAAAVPRARPVALALVVGAVGLAPVLSPAWTAQHFLADDTPLRTHAALFDRLRSRMTPQDRVHLALPLNRTPGLQEKTATLFALRAIADYETQMTQRYAEYVTMLLSGQVLQSINQVYYAGPWDARRVRWPLVDLAATRYLVIDQSVDNGLDAGARAPLTPVDGDDTVRIYENASALPRAYYVPQIRVVANPETGLQRLAARLDDPRVTALVDAAPTSGFLGAPGNALTAAADFVIDEPERVVLEVTAPERGFVFLADEYFPGWSATVNGQPVPILLANHTFRLVEVPKGPVTVEFRYRPRRVWIGALVSGSTLVLVAAALLQQRRRRQRPLLADEPTPR